MNWFCSFIRYELASASPVSVQCVLLRIKSPHPALRTCRISLHHISHVQWAPLQGRPGHRHHSDAMLEQAECPAVLHGTQAIAESCLLHCPVSDLSPAQDKRLCADLSERLIGPDLRNTDINSFEWKFEDSGTPLCCCNKSWCGCGCGVYCNLLY